MRILHIIPSVSPEGGGPIEGILRQNDVTKSSVERHLVTIDEPKAAFLANFPMRVIPLAWQNAPQSRWARIRKRYGFSPLLMPWLKNNVDNYDAVVVHGLWNYSTFAARWTLVGKRINYFVFCHGMMDPWFKRKYPLKHVLKQLFWLLVEGPLLRSARAVFFTSEEECRLARASFWGWKGYREQIVGYGTSNPPDNSDEQLSAFFDIAPLLQGKRFILFLSRIHEKKGCDLLIEAFARVASSDKNLNLVIAGPDQQGLKARLADRAKTLGVDDRVYWPGLLTGNAKWGAFRSAEAFILPSHQENFGIVVAEAMACSTPVLISDKVNIWREVESTGGGLVAPDTLEGTHLMLRKWNSLSLGERQAMRIAAKQGFDRHFNFDKTAFGIIDIISAQKSDEKTRNIVAITTERIS